MLTELRLKMKPLRVATSSKSQGRLQRNKADSEDLLSLVV